MYTNKEILEILEVEFQSLRNEDERINLFFNGLDIYDETASIVMTIDGIKGEYMHDFSYESIVEHFMQKRLLAIAKFNIAKGNKTLQGI